MNAKLALTAIFSIALFGFVRTQTCITLGEEMPDFRLTSYQGQEVTPSDQQGKKMLYIFVRGRVSDHWCQICSYQYAELAEKEKENAFMEKYDLGVVFVLPYSMDEVKEWVSLFPEQMSVIEGWKYPDDPDNLPENRKQWMETARKLFPLTITYENDIDLPFPILADPDRSLSKELGLFTTFWDRSYVEQNIPAVFLFDESGKLRFKYISQTTVDRPSSEYLFEVLDKMME